jgi:hypothetical protein
MYIGTGSARSWAGDRQGQPADVVRSVMSPDSDVLSAVWWQLAASALAEAFTTASYRTGPEERPT